MVSVIIPSRRERWLDKTINEIKTKFGGEYEIIVVLEEDPKSPLPEGVNYIEHKEAIGMRTSINEAVAVAQGKYILKLDAHCMLDENIDLKLIAEHQYNWVQIPRRKRLNPHKWQLVDDGRPDVDYMYIWKPYFIGRVNRGMNLDPELRKILIDDTGTFQGSCYFMEREYFLKLGLLDDVNFDQSGHEAQEITLKVLHDGGRIIRNKKTWYAHARTSRLYTVDRTRSRQAIIKLAEEYGYSNS